MTNKTEVLDDSELERIRGLMADVVDKSSKRKDACVYRGEPACYPIVSSGLFRACPDSANEAFDIARVEEEMVADARKYTALAGHEEILTEIQHFGGRDKPDRFHRRLSHCPVLRERRERTDRRESRAALARA